MTNICSRCRSIMDDYDVGVCAKCKKELESLPPGIEEIIPDIVPDYEKAYHLLAEYWDYVPDEDKQELSKKLTELGV